MGNKAMAPAERVENRMVNFSLSGIQNWGIDEVLSSNASARLRWQYLPSLSRVMGSAVASEPRLYSNLNAGMSEALKRETLLRCDDCLVLQD
jgi:hypothetical protein